MINEKLLAKLPKKYQPLVEQLYIDAYDCYAVQLKKGYGFKSVPANDCGEANIIVGKPTWAGVLKLFREELTEQIPTVKGGKREGAGRKSQGYKMVSIRMTEEEKVAVKEFLKKRRSEK